MPGPEPTGWLCVADGDWLDYLRAAPTARPLIYYKGPFRPTTQLPIGAPFVCCRNHETPRRVHLLARFDGYDVLDLNTAWNKYGERLGLPSRDEWLALNAGNGGRVSCHRLAEPVFLDSPVLLESTGVTLTNAASSMGRYLHGGEAQQLLTSIGSSLPPVTTGEDETFVEGAELLRMHRQRERNRKAIARKKAKVLASTKCLGCEVCGFDFSAFYGSLGSDYAECHHRLPISQIVGEYKLKLSDLAIVCSNCHRMLHRRPFHSIPQLRTVIELLRLTGSVA